MADIVDKETRSRMMSGIRGRDTKPELTLRRALHQRGLRYRLHGADLPGRPDLVFPRRKAVIFVHGCFWHRHEGCQLATTPTSNIGFWVQKFEKTVERDSRNMRLLHKAHWRVAVVWECALRRYPVEAVAENVGTWLKSADTALELTTLTTIVTR